MKGNSNTYPKQFEKSAGKIQFRYNIIQVEKVDEFTGEPSISFDYEYVEVNNTNEKTLIDAMIRDKYDVNDEIALIRKIITGKITKDEINTWGIFVEDMKTKAKVK